MTILLALRARLVRRALPLVIGVIALAGPAAASTTLDFITFDGIDYIRWPEEPGRALTPGDLGTEFGAIQCSLGEDVRGCPYGMDAGAAFLPAGTRIYAMRGYATEFRLVALVRDRIFLYQVWRNPRAKVGGDLYRLVRQGARHRRPAWSADPGGPRNPATIAAPPDVEALVEMLARSPVERPQAHAFGEPRYWLTFWLIDGTTLERAFFVDTRELMGGVVLPEEFRTRLERQLRD